MTLLFLLVAMLGLPVWAMAQPGGGGGFVQFRQLIDTPPSYAGSGDLCVRVNPGETGLVYAGCVAGSGQAVFLDLADDASNESIDLGEIATTGDTNNIFTEPSPDKLLIDLTQNWPTADAATTATTATSLAANGNNCTAGSAPVGVDASGNAEGCASLASDDVTDNNIADLSNVNADANAADDEVMVGDGTAYRGIALPNCNPATQKSFYNAGTNTWSCETDTGGSPFLDLTDNGVSNSLALVEIATTGDTNTIFSEPLADKLLINVGLNWPVADAAATLNTPCTSGQVLKNTGGTSWACAGDNVGSTGGTLDLADDDVDESTALAEIATTGDTNNIFTEPTADKLLINVGLNWPTADLADTATALAANGANCLAGEVAGGVDASGAAESCINPIVATEMDTEAELEAILTDVTNVFTNNDGALNDDDLTNNTIADLSNVNADAIATDDLIMVADGTEFRGVVLPDCDADTEKLMYNPTTNLFDCEVDVGVATIVNTQAITAATDTIDCGSNGQVVVVLSADSDYILTSNPQIAAGGATHVCTLLWTDTVDSLTIVDGNGVNNYGDVSQVLSVVGQAVTYYYDGAAWQELAPILPGCTYTFPGGIPTLDCGQTTTITRIVDTEFIPVNWCNDGAAPPAASASVGQMDHRDFDSASSENLLCSWHVPDDFNESVVTDKVKVKAVYLITNATAPIANEGVSWGFAGCSSGVGDAVACTPGTEVNSETADLSAHVQNDIVEDAFVEVTITDLTAGEWVRFAVNRDVADTDDDYGQDVGLVGFIIKFFRSPGSVVY